jgi:hypothetical protein
MYESAAAALGSRPLPLDEPAGDGLLPGVATGGGFCIRNSPDTGFETSKRNLGSGARYYVIRYTGSNVLSYY